LQGPCGATQTFYVSNWILWKCGENVRGGDGRVGIGPRKVSLEGATKGQVA